MSQSLDRGNIVMVDFPYSDRTGSTVRPALVVQEDGLNRQLDDTILAMITSSRRRMKGTSTQLLMEKSHPDFAMSGLRLDSVIQCENLVTIDQTLVLRVIGTLSTTTMHDIDACLKAALAIS